MGISTHGFCPRCAGKLRVEPAPVRVSRLRGVPLLAVVAVLALSFADHASAGGAALRWKGQVDTDLYFSEFFAGDNTIMGRFMVQYPRAYRGPIFGVQGPRCLACASGPSFELGMGSYGEGSAAGTKLVLEVAGKARYFSVEIPAGVWQHVALPRMNGLGVSMFQLYLNGVHWCADAPSPCDLTLVGLSGTPAGTLALGRNSSATTRNPAGQHQFYGLLDDVAVYSTALSPAQIQSDASMGNPLDGSEAGLLAGYTFEIAPASPKLTRPVTFTGNAYLDPFMVPTTEWNSSALDAKMLPLANKPFIVGLPFTAGQQWKVIQTYGGTESHNGISAFALDFARVDGATIGCDVIAPLGGTVVAVDDSHDEIGHGACPKQTKDGTEYVNCNVIQIQVDGYPGFVLSFRHIGKNTSEFAHGEHVDAGDKIATVGDHVNTPHLHIGARTGPDSDPNAVSFPVAVKNYKQWNPYGWWDTVSLGVPPEKVTVSPL